MKTRYGIPLDTWFKRLTLVAAALSTKPGEIKYKPPWYPGYEYQKETIFRQERNALGEYANRGGKTLIAALEDTTLATFPEKSIWIVAAELFLSTTCWHYCLQNLLWLNKLGLIAMPRYSLVRREINMPNGSFIHAKSFRNPASLESLALDLIDLEELSNPATDIGWIEQFMPTRLYQKKGSFIGYTTPIEGGEWRQWTLDMRERKDCFWIEGISAYQFPHIDNDEIERLRELMPPDYFEERVLGKYTEYIGKVYSEFNPSPFDDGGHVIGKSFEIPEDIELFGGLDFGETQAYNYFLLIGWSHKLHKYLVLDECKIKTTKMAVFCGEIKKLLKEWKLDPERFLIFGDDAGGSRAGDGGMPILELQHMGLYNLRPAQKNMYFNYYLESIRRLNGHFRSGNILIHKRCEYLIKRELPNYIWDRKRNRPIDTYNDGLDSLRYAIWGYMLDSGWTVEELFGIYDAFDNKDKAKFKYKPEQAETPEYMYEEPYVAMASVFKTPLPKFSSMPLKGGRFS